MLILSWVKMENEEPDPILEVKTLPATQKASRCGTHRATGPPFPQEALLSLPQGSHREGLRGQQDAELRPSFTPRYSVTLRKSFQCSHSYASFSIKWGQYSYLLPNTVFGRIRWKERLFIKGILVIYGYNREE